MSPRISDWRIRLDPIGPGGEGGTLDVINGDKSDAAEWLDYWAISIEQQGHVPRGLEWLNESPAVIIEKVSSLRYKARVDCFERETEHGMTIGYGWLYAVQEPC